MFNLVQLQERLKGMPMQALMSYANGSNPQVPPYLALGELHRRKKMQESAAAEQAQAMEGAPTIKEQIEQSTGLLALQGARQRQASQQQASQMASAPMPAPNTMTSEPVQMAMGGAVNDVQVPSVFQAGGQINPNALKKLMMLKALQQRRQGVGNIPVGNMFQRSNYANGGIVAFQTGGQAKRVGGKTLQEYLASVNETLNSMPQLTEEEKQQRRQMAIQQFMSSQGDSAGANNYPDESRRGSGSFAIERGEDNKLVRPDFSREFSPRDRDRFRAGQNEEAFMSRRPIPSQGLKSLDRALALKPEDVYPEAKPRSIEAILDEQKRRQGLAGVDEKYLDERERRLEKIQAQREASRAEEPLDRLIKFLGGVAEARGGNWATQGAQGAKAVAALRAEQKALRDKQDMEMEALRFASAEKRDALRRGDLKAAEVAEAKEQELARIIKQDRAKMVMDQAKIANQARQTEYYGQQVSRPTDFERQKELYLQHTRETGEKPTAAGFQRFILGGKASTVMTMEDAIRIAAQSLGQGATMQDIQQRAMELMRLSGSGGAPPASSGRTVDFRQLPK